MAFRPKVNDIIHVDNKTLHFTEHPSAKGMPYGQTGRRATVYQVQDLHGAFYALKVFNLAFRSPIVEQQSRQIARFHTIAGLEACQRDVITPQMYANLLQVYPDLSYAVVMPWVQGTNWQEIILGRKPLDPDSSKVLATSFIHLMALLEQRGIAHCDLSGPNLIIDFDRKNSSIPVSLIDLEDLYAPGLIPPQKLPAGSAGYAHPQARSGVWSGEADRFAGAILVAEMLGWCDERVRRIAYGEQYFDPSEMQTTCERYQLLLQVLRERWGAQIANVFSQAWFAPTLAACPTFANWVRAIDPPPDPVELRAQIMRLERMGRWNEVLQTCDELLKLDGSQTEIWSIRARAQQAQKLDADILKAWDVAAKSGLTQDWEACLKLIISAELLGPDVVKYQAQKEQAEQEMDAALRLDQAEENINTRKWAEAEQLLLGITPIQPRYTPLRLKLDQVTRLEKEVDQNRLVAKQAIERQDWQTALSALAAIEKVQPLDSELLALKSQAETLETKVKELERKAKELQSKLTKAREHLNVGEFDLAEACVNEILQDFPKNPQALQILPEIQTRRSHYQTFQKAVKEYQDGNLEEALEILNTLPQNFENSFQLREQISQRLSWRKQLENERQKWHPKEVLSILKWRPKDETERPDLENWAMEMIGLEKAINEAYSQGDLSQLISLLENAPSDYPNRTDLLNQTRHRLEIQQIIREGLAAYDLDLINEVLEELPPNDKNYPELIQWSKREENLRAQINQTYQDINLVTANQLLEQMPEDHPLRRNFQEWLEHEKHIRERIMTAFEQYDLESLELIVNSLPENHPLKGPSQKRLNDEKERRKMLEQAQRVFDGEAVLKLLSEVDKDYPDYDQLEMWAEEELNRQENIRQALLDEDIEEIEKLLNGLPPTHPYTQDLQEWLENEQQPSSEEEKEQQERATEVKKNN